MFKGKSICQNSQITDRKSLENIKNTRNNGKYEEIRGSFEIRPDLFQHKSFLCWICERIF